MNNIIHSYQIHSGEGIFVTKLDKFVTVDICLCDECKRIGKEEQNQLVLSNHYAWHAMNHENWQHLIPQIRNRSCGQKGLIRASKNMILILEAINKTSICTDVEVEIWLSQPLEFTQFVGICWFGRWWRASFLGTWASFFIWNTQPQAPGTLPQTGIPFLGEVAAGHNVGKRSERGNRSIERIVCPKTTFGQTTPNKGLSSALSLSFSCVGINQEPRRVVLNPLRWK